MRRKLGRLLFQMPPRRVCGAVAWRISTFNTAGQGKSPGTTIYITVSFKDTKNLYKLKIDGKAVGGYTWIYSGWFGYYHNIILCPTSFTIDTLVTKLEQVEEELSRGITKMASDMSWLNNQGQFFLHEMIHTRLVYDNEPEIIDEYDSDERVGPKAYGPRGVHKLATRKIDNGGGA